MYRRRKLRNGEKWGQPPYYARHLFRRLDLAHTVMKLSVSTDFSQSFWSVVNK